MATMGFKNSQRGLVFFKMLWTIFEKDNSKSPPFINIANCSEEKKCGIADHHRRFQLTETDCNANICANKI